MIRRAAPRPKPPQIRAYPGFLVRGRASARLLSAAHGSQILAVLHRQLVPAPPGERVALDTAANLALVADVLAWHDYDCLTNTRHPARLARVGLDKEARALVRLPDGPPAPSRLRWRVASRARYVEPI